MQLLLVKLRTRTHQAVKFQEVITKHGCLINMRLGLHETDGTCSDEGVILLKLESEADAQPLVHDLKAIGEIDVKHVQM